MSRVLKVLHFPFELWILIGFISLQLLASRHPVRNESFLTLCISLKSVNLKSKLPDQVQFRHVEISGGTSIPTGRSFRLGAIAG